MSNDDSHFFEKIASTYFSYYDNQNTKDLLYTWKWIIIPSLWDQYKEFWLRKSIRKSIYIKWKVFLINANETIEHTNLT